MKGSLVANRSFSPDDEIKEIKEFMTIYNTLINEHNTATTSLINFGTQVLINKENYTRENIDISNILMDKLQETFNALVPFIAFEIFFSKHVQEVRERHIDFLTKFITEEEDKKQIIELIRSGNKITIKDAFSCFIKDSNE